MRWLNYHHLLYFHTVAREGSVVAAAERLSLTQPTISGQLRLLEESLGERLFERKGRRLVLTEVGRTVYRYADEIFGLGRELLDVLEDRPTGRPLRLAVGISDAMPKMMAAQLLSPALGLPGGVQLLVRDDKTERLLAMLSVHELDVVLAEVPMSPGVSVKAFNHLLVESGVSLFGAPAVAAKLRRGFPDSLNAVRMLLPAPNTALRRSLDEWLERRGVRPQVAGEIEDSGLLTALAAGTGAVFAAPILVSDEVCRQYRVKEIGALDGVMERFYAISIEKRLKHPAVVAIAESAVRGQSAGGEAPTARAGKTGPEGSSREKRGAGSGSKD
jgi:LysR family transcriptional activator of nhaA